MGGPQGTRVGRHDASTAGPVFGTTALLGRLQLAVEIPLYLGLAAGVARTGAWFRRPRIRARFEAVSGTVLVGLGLRVAVEHV